MIYDYSLVLTCLLRFQAGSEAGASGLGLAVGSDGVLASIAGVTDSPNLATGRTGAAPLFFSNSALRWLKGNKAGSGRLDVSDFDGDLDSNRLRFSAIDLDNDKVFLV